MASILEEFNKRNGQAQNNAPASGASTVNDGGILGALNQSLQKRQQTQQQAQKQIGSANYANRKLNQYVNRVNDTLKGYDVNKWQSDDDYKELSARLASESSDLQNWRKEVVSNKDSYDADAYSAILGKIDEIGGLYSQLSLQSRSGNARQNDYIAKYGDEAQAKFDEDIITAQKWQNVYGMNRAETEAEIQRLVDTGTVKRDFDNPDDWEAIAQEEAKLSRERSNAELTYRDAVAYGLYDSAYVDKLKADYDNAVSAYDAFMANPTTGGGNQKEIDWIKENYLPMADYYAGEAKYGSLDKVASYDILDRLAKAQNEDERAYLNNYIDMSVQQSGMIGRENYASVAESQRAFDAIKSGKVQDAVRTAAKFYNEPGTYGADTYLQALKEGAEKTGLTQDQLDAYVKSSASYLAQEENERINGLTRQYASGAGGIAGTLATYALNPTANIEADTYLLLSQITGQTPEIANEAMRGYQFVQGTRGTVAENIEKVTNLKIGNTNVASWIYQAINSTVDSAVNMEITSGVLNMTGLAPTAAEGFGKLASGEWWVRNTVSNAIMGSGAAVDAFIQAKQQGASNDRALAKSLISGFVEGLTEAIEGETLVNIIEKKSGAALNAALKSALSEGVEEWASNEMNRAIGNWLFDENNATIRRNLKVLIEGYKAAGYDSKEAAKKAFTEAMSDDTSSFLSGAFSGLLMGLLGFNVRWGNDIRTGNSIVRENGGRSNAVAKVNEEIRNVNSITAPDGISVEVLKDNASRMRIGRAVRIANENRSYANTRDAMKEVSPLVRQSLQDSGIAETSLDAATAAVTKSFVGDVLSGRVSSEREGRLLELSKEEQRMAGLPAVNAAYENLMKNAGDALTITVNKVVREKAESNDAGIQPGQDATQYARDKASIIRIAKTYGESSAALQMVRENKGSLKESQAVAIYEDNVPELKPNLTESGDLALPDSIDNASRVVFRRAFNAIKDAENRETYSMYAVQAYNIGKNFGTSKYAEDYLTDIAELHPEIADEIRTAFERGASQATDVQKTARGTGGARLMTADEVLSVKGEEVHAVDTSKMNRKERQRVARYVQFHNEFGRAIGVDFVFFDSRINGKLTGKSNGWFDAKTNTIYLDINAGLDNGGSLVFTTAHELTHYIAKNSASEYRVLRDFIIDKFYEGSREEFDKRVSYEMQRNNLGSEEDAIEEIVAQSCENMLMNSSVITELAQRDMNTAQKISKFLRDFAKKFNDVVKRFVNGNKAGNYYANQLMKSADAMNELQELWDRALMAAISDKATDGGAETGEQAKESAATMDGVNTTENQGIRYSQKSIPGSYDYSKSFAQQIDDLDAGLIPRTDSLIVGGTPDVLKKIGFVALPMTYGQGHAREILRGNVADHDFGKDILKQLPTAMKRPVAVIRSVSQPATSVVVIAEFTHAGKQIIEAVEVNGFGHENSNRIDSYAITTMHKRGNAARLLYDAIAAENAGNVVGVYYADKEKTTRLLRRGGLQLPTGTNIPDGYTNKITDSKAEVNPRIQNNIDTKQFRRWFDNSVVVNDDGTPMIMYHGTTAKFDTFAIGDIGYHVGTYAQARERVNGENAARIMPLYVSISNPLHASFDFGDWHGKNVAGMLIETEAFEDNDNRDKIEKRLSEIAQMPDNTDTDAELRDYLESLGYDGIRYENEFETENRYNGEYEYSYIAFRPNQLKSIYNTGLYSSNSDNVYYSLKETSDREILSDALMDAAQTDEERTMLTNYQKSIREYEEKEAQLAKIASEIKELSFAPGNIDTERIKALQLEANKLRRSITNYDKGLLKLEAAEPLNRVLEREKAAAERRTIERGRERLREYRINRDQSEAVKKYRKRIEDKVKKLSDELLINSDKKHIPEPLRKPLSEFIQSLNFDSKRLTSGGAETQKDIRFRERAQALALALQSYDGSDGYVDLPADQIAYITEQLNAVTRAIDSYDGDGSIYLMDAAQLKQLDSALGIIDKAVSTVNEFMANRRYAQVATASQETMNDLDSLGQSKTMGNVLGLLKKLGAWDNATPFYAFRRMGNAAQAMFQSVQDGWDKMALNSQRVIEFSKSAYTSAQQNEWSKEVLTIELSEKNGKARTVRMTVAQAMSLYCLAKRQQAVGHILGGGIRVGDFEDGRTTVKQSDPYTLLMEDVQNIIASLTEEQRSVADKLQNYMNTVGSDWGNEVSMARFGYKAFGELNYFPIESDKTNLSGVSPEARDNDMFRLLNMSSTKSLTKGANNALMLYDIFDVFANHMSDMAKYNALALPILDMVKWYNYKEKIDNPDGTHDTKTLQRSLEKAFGTYTVGEDNKSVGYANNYVKKFLNDLNGASSGGREVTGLSALMGRYKKSAVGTNLRVAVQQPMSIMRAQAVIDPKWIAKGYLNVREGREEMLKYSGIAVWKDLGFYDTNIGRDIAEQIKHEKTFMNWIDDKSMWLAQQLDSVTWGALWSAAKAEQESKGLTGRALIAATNERFRDIIYASQVVDSTVTRSDLMRSPSQLAKIYTSFMSEPTLTWNMMLDVYMDAHYARRRGESIKGITGKALRTGYALVTNAAAIAIVTALMDAWRDDDSYETFWEKFTEKAPENFLDELNPIDKIAVIRKAWDTLASDYQNNTVDTAWLNDIKSTIDIFIEDVKLWTNPYYKPTDATYNGKMTPWGQIYQFLKTASDISGIPMGSLAREVTSAWNNIVVPFAGERARIKTYNESPNTVGFPNLVEAIIDGDESRQMKIESAMAVNGLSDKKIADGIKAALKTFYLDGEIDEDELADILCANCGYEPTGTGGESINYLIDSWNYGTGYKLATNLEAAFADGDAAEVKNAVEFMRTRYSYDDSKIKSAVTLYWKETYKAADEAERKRIRELILATGLYDAKTLDKKLNEWAYSD